MRNWTSIVIIIAISQTYGQEKKHYDFGFSSGVILQDELFGEANLIIGAVHDSKMIVGFSGARIGLETNFKNDSRRKWHLQSLLNFAQ